jgi:RNA polymerase sigma-70 factor (ECF subfamily)
LSDDAQLIAAARAGDSEAFGRLVERYQDRLYNSLLRVLGSAEDARDAVQEAFVQAYLKLDTFRGTAAFYTWLYRVAFNLAMSHARKRRPKTSLDEAKESFGHEPVDGQPTPDVHLVRCERVQLVQAALAALGTESRQILVLRELEGCRYDQIAEILELPVGTVRSRLFRAREQLREQLEPMLREQSVTTHDDV